MMKRLTLLHILYSLLRPFIVYITCISFMVYNRSLARVSLNTSNCDEVQQRCYKCVCECAGTSFASFSKAEAKSCNTIVTFVHFRTYELTDWRIYGLTEIRTYGFTDRRIFGLTDLRVDRLTEFRLCRYTDLRFDGFTNHGLTD